MPELPEVETIRNQLNKVLRGKTIKEIEVLREKSFSGDPTAMRGWKIQSIERKSKILEVMFENQPDIVIVHLKMTGQLIYVNGEKRILGGHPSPDWVNQLPSKHTRVIWNFDDGTKLFFNDMRVFGWMKIINFKEYEKYTRKTVPDITEKGFTTKYLFDILNRSEKPIKLVLLDQDKIGGLGNIYVNDALYLAKIRPDRKSDSLERDEGISLHKAICTIIKRGIKYGGASASNYVQVSGLGGTYQDHFLVYKKEGEKCKRCGGVIKKIKLGGRGTFYCSDCQK